MISFCFCWFQKKPYLSTNLILYYLINHWFSSSNFRGNAVVNFSFPLLILWWVKFNSWLSMIYSKCLHSKQGICWVECNGFWTFICFKRNNLILSLTCKKFKYCTCAIITYSSIITSIKYKIRLLGLKMEEFAYFTTYKNWL